ncbi:MAG: SDR family oxidoreductase [Alicyclobacillus sp.]|nr:SDR family oxidoreductase [Alicyclobacillus sp.]
MHVARLLDLTGKTALVTGGGRGLGQQITFALAEGGADVIVCSRQLDICEDIAAEVRQQTGRQAYALPLDVSRPESVAETVAKAVALTGKIDILVNNAGTAWGAPATEMPPDKWDHVMAVNARGTFLMSQAVGRLMIDRRYGRIINMASICGFMGFPSEVLDAVGYHASKGAVIALTRDLAVKWAPFGVTVNAVAPGFFPSRMTRGVLDQGGEHILRRTPMGRFGGEDDLKGIIVYLASDASAYMTGQVLNVDGGASAG